jgi:hypothetical protein
MKRFLTLWLVIAPATAVAAAATSFLVFRHVDLTHDGFVHVVAVPIVQAMAILLALRPPAFARLRAMARGAVGHPFVGPVLALDAVVVGAGWILRETPIVGFAGQGSIQSIWAGTKAIAAAGFLAIAALNPPPTQRDAPGGRIWLWIFVAFVTGFGFNAFLPWMAALPGLVFVGAAAGLPRVFKWLILYGSLAVVAIWAAVRSAECLSGRTRTAAALLTATTTLAVGCLTLAVSNLFLRPFLVQPVSAIVDTGASLAMTCALSAGLMAALAPAVHGTGASRVGV